MTFPFKNGQRRLLIVYFRPFINTNTVQNLTIKCVDGVLGTRTRGCRMVGADESIELWRDFPFIQ